MMGKTYHTWEAPAACPRCGGPSVGVRYSDHPEWPLRPEQCAACLLECARQRKAFEANMRSRWPMLSERTTLALIRAFREQGWHALLAATDDAILDGRNIGRKTLAEFRSVWPTPIADMATDDAWRDHAEMVAGVR